MQPDREGVDYILGVGAATTTDTATAKRTRKRKFPFGFGKEPGNDKAKEKNGHQGSHPH